MPFKSKSQMRACFAKKKAGTAGSWNCEEWASHTPSTKSLPERSKNSSDSGFVSLPQFTKIAKKLFNPDKSPPVKDSELQARSTQAFVNDTISKRAVKSEKAAHQSMQKRAAFQWDLSITKCYWIK